MRKLVKTTIAWIATLSLLVGLFSVSAITTSAASSYLFPVKDGRLAYYYGYSASYGGTHTGIDIHATSSDVIYAAYSGTVDRATDPCSHTDWAKSHSSDCGHYNTFGNYIRIKQDDGKYAYYGHLLQGSLRVASGTYVRKGQPIARMGSSGASTGKHLHFEVRNSTTSSDTYNVNPTSAGGSVEYTYSGYDGEENISYTSIETGTYVIKNHATGLYLDVYSSQDVDQANVQVYPYHGTNNQLFSITSASDGYKVRPLCSSSRLVNPYADTVVSGKNVNLYHDTNDSSQWWKFEKVSGGYIIHNVQNSSVVLDVDSSHNVYVNTRSGAASQVWALQTQITYNANGGSGAPSSQFKEHGSTLTLSSAVPTREGYDFLGWSTNANATSAQYAAGGSFTSNANTTLYAVWKYKTYSVNYNANGGTGVPSNQTKTHDVALTLSSTVPTRAGYTFLGWSTSSTATSATYSASGSFTMNANTTLYAVWKANTYTISYNANGGTGAPSNQTKTHDVALTLSSTVPMRAGYTFLGWSTSSTATSASYQAGGKFTTNAHTTLYAVWEENKLMGDIVEDGKLNTFDALILFAAASGQGELTDAQRAVADMNGDGTINMFDALLLFKEVSGD